MPPCAFVQDITTALLIFLFFGWVEGRCGGEAGIGHSGKLVGAKSAPSPVTHGFKNVIG